MSPIFSYQCPNCGERFEKLAKTKDNPPFCPVCNKPTIQVWSVPSTAIWKCSKGSL